MENNKAWNFIEVAVAGGWPLVKEAVLYVEGDIFPKAISSLQSLFSSDFWM
jgi:hypothetical protein